MLVHFEVFVVRHHVYESGRRRILDDENRIPPWSVAVADDVSRRGTAIADLGTGPFEMRTHLLPVLQMPLKTPGCLNFNKLTITTGASAGRAASAANCSGVGSNELVTSTALIICRS